jgi:hypothetical protein
MRKTRILLGRWALRQPDRRLPHRRRSHSRARRYLHAGLRRYGGRSRRAPHSPDGRSRLRLPLRSASLRSRPGGRGRCHRACLGGARQPYRHYVGAQLVGAVLGAFATWITFGGPARAEAKLAATYPAQGVGDLQAFVVEILTTFILVFVVMAVATDERAPAAIAPIAVGFALAVGVFIAGPVTRGSVNPARSLGPMIVEGISRACGSTCLDRSSEGCLGRCSTTAPWPRPKAQHKTGGHRAIRSLGGHLPARGGGTYATVPRVLVRPSSRNGWGAPKMRGGRWGGCAMRCFRRFKGAPPTSCCPSPGRRLAWSTTSCRLAR